MFNWKITGLISSAVTTTKSRQINFHENLVDKMLMDAKVAVGVGNYKEATDIAISLFFTFASLPLSLPRVRYLEFAT